PLKGAPPADRQSRIRGGRLICRFMRRGWKTEMQTIRYELDAQGIATITFDQAGSSVNTMCLAWQDEFASVVARVVDERERIAGIVLASAKSTFFAGADLKAVMRATPAEAARCFAEIERIKKNFRTLETLGKPVVACLN